MKSDFDKFIEKAFDVFKRYLFNFYVEHVDQLLNELEDYIKKLKDVQIITLKDYSEFINNTAKAEADKDKFGKEKVIVEQALKSLT